MERLSHRLAILPSSDNYNVNDWVLKETLLGRILNSARAALCTWESLQTLSRFLISSVRKIGAYYTVLSESLIIIFVRAALFISTLVSSDCKLYSPLQRILVVRHSLLPNGSEALSSSSSSSAFLLLSLPLRQQEDATRRSASLFVLSLADKLIAKQKVLACVLSRSLVNALQPQFHSAGQLSG